MNTPQSPTLTPGNLRNYRVLLASNSPRRKELLQLLGLDFEVVSHHKVDEDWPETMSPMRVPEYLAVRKASAYLPELHNHELLITADTVVVLDGKLLGKPHDAQEAMQMLRELSGKTHMVVTGVYVCDPLLQLSFSVTTQVEFAELTEEDIRKYVEFFKPLDKAGAYGIQEWIGAVGIKGIHGSFYNVMGLPVHALYEALKHFDSDIDRRHISSPSKVMVERIKVS